MNGLVLYHPRTRPTGRALAKELGFIGAKHCRTKKYENISHIVRWGNAEEVPRTYRSDSGYRNRTELNTRKAVALASSKYRALQAMQKAGVPVPAFSRNWRDLEGGVVLGRSFRHMQGRDIRIHENDIESLPSDGHDYYTQFIEPHKEYRIHVFGGNILFAQKKYFGQELHDKLADEIRKRYGADALKVWRLDTEFIRNNEHGWRFYDMTDVRHVPSAVKSASISAVDALGLDFGAVDVIAYGRDENGRRRASVLEINTGPGLRGRNLEKYARAIRTVWTKS